MIFPYYLIINVIAILFCTHLFLTYAMALCQSRRRKSYFASQKILFGTTILTALTGQCALIANQFLMKYSEDLTIALLATSVLHVGLHYFAMVRKIQEWCCCFKAFLTIFTLDCMQVLVTFASLERFLQMRSPLPRGKKVNLTTPRTKALSVSLILFFIGIAATVAVVMGSAQVWADVLVLAFNISVITADSFLTLHMVISALRSYIKSHAISWSLPGTRSGSWGNRRVNNNNGSGNAGPAAVVLPSFSSSLPALNQNVSDQSGSTSGVGGHKKCHEPDIVNVYDQLIQEGEKDSLVPQYDEICMKYQISSRSESLPLSSSPSASVSASAAISKDLLSSSSSSSSQKPPLQLTMTKLSTLSSSSSSGTPDRPRTTSTALIQYKKLVRKLSVYFALLILVDIGIITAYTLSRSSLRLMPEVKSLACSLSVFHIWICLKLLEMFVDGVFENEKQACSL